jgi:hypothetical protein
MLIPLSSRLTTLAIATTLTGLLATGLIAQSPSTVPLGTRVRFSPARDTHHLVIGTVVGQRGDSLLLAAPHDTVAVPLNSGSLAVSQGRHRATLRGLGLGLLAGAVAGAVAGAAMEPDELLGRGVNIAAGVIIGGGAGLVVGTVWGASTTRERWVAAAPNHPGPGVGVSRARRVEIGLSVPF